MSTGFIGCDLENIRPDRRVSATERMRIFKDACAFVATESAWLQQRPLEPRPRP